MKKIKIEDKVALEIIKDHGKTETAIKDMTRQMWKKLHEDAEEFFGKIRESIPQLEDSHFSLMLVDGEWYAIQKEGV